MIPIATALINGRPVTLEEKDGYYFYTFTADTQTVDIQHLGCIGETQITELQIEKNDHQTYYVPPDVTYHPMAEILREMTHVRLELTDPESDFRSSLLLTNQGLLTEFENGPTMSALKQTAASYERRFEGMEDGKTLVNYVQETKDGILSVLTSTTAKLVKSQEEEYYRSTSQTALTGGTWQTSIPSRTTGQSIWRRYRDVYADGTKSVWKPSVNGVNITGDKGDQGTKGRGITAVVMEYGKSTSNTVPPTSWVSTPPQANVYPTKEYVWEREKITWDMAPTTTYTSPRLSEVGNLARDFRVVNDTVTAYERIMGGTDDQGRLTKLTQQLQTNAGFKRAVTDKISGLQTTTTQLAGSWAVQNLTSAGTVLSQLNVNSGGVKIQGKLINLDGTVTMDSAFAKKLMVDTFTTNDMTAFMGKFGSIIANNLDVNNLSGNKATLLQALFNGENSDLRLDGRGFVLSTYNSQDPSVRFDKQGLDFFVRASDTLQWDIGHIGHLYDDNNPTDILKYQLAIGVNRLWKLSLGYQGNNELGKYTSALTVNGFDGTIEFLTPPRFVNSQLMVPDLGTVSSSSVSYVPFKISYNSADKYFNFRIDKKYGLEYTNGTWMLYDNGIYKRIMTF